ncbi:MAG: right-handed parallel beta-helix repeat-containing protein [Candidatus Zixiibacteriota bacterium]|nr:MAG: right-handed parallel beta-helix repeat-containing protein [candidate division Zixibacteria bacterium]
MFRSNNFSAISRAFIVAAIVVILVPYAGADVTFVAGDVSGVWTADSVIVIDSVRVPAGESLAIVPGVTVLFTSYYKFEVLDNAVLHAVGTATDSIKFLPFTQGDRTLGIDFINASDQSVMEYCYISDALTSGIHLENSDITVRNCLIENSEAPTGSDGGGGIEVLNGSNALIENNIIRDNYSADYGGGIYVSASSPVIIGNTISGNIAGYYGHAYGGGIYVANNSNPQIMNNVITDNAVHPSGSFTIRNGGGGGIFVSGGSGIVISGNVISDNLVNAEPQTRSNGGGIYVSSSNPYVSNNHITGNEAEGDNGGGVYLNGADAQLINNTIAYNVANDSGGGLYLQNSSPLVVNSIVYFNQADYGHQIFESNSFTAVYYSDVQGSWPGVGNLDVDPLFRDAVAGDYHLQAQMCGDQFDSPLIDVGSPEYADSLVACEWGLGTELSDMGAYGGGALGSPTSVDDDNIVATPSQFFTVSNYPNPFNATTTIRYRLAEPSHVTIDIYDDLGRKVTNLVNRRQLAGEHNVEWNASNVASGMYFYRLEINGYSKNAKMLLLK